MPAGEPSIPSDPCRHRHGRFFIAYTEEGLSPTPEKPEAVACDGSKTPRTNTTTRARKSRRRSRQRRRGRGGDTPEGERQGKRRDDVSRATPHRGRPGEAVRRRSGGARALRLFCGRQERRILVKLVSRASRELPARDARRRDPNHAGRAETSRRQIFPEPIIRRATSGDGGDAGSDRDARPGARAARGDRLGRERGSRTRHVHA